MDYKKLLKSVLPKIIYKVGDTNLIYEISYVDIKTVDGKAHAIDVAFNRVDENKKYSVAKHVLCRTLQDEYGKISKYLADFRVLFLIREGHDVCI